MLYTKHNTAIIDSNDIKPREIMLALKSMQSDNLNALFISSLGGAASALFYGISHLLPKRITTIGGDEVASAALNLFLCGEQRLALPTSTFTFHEAGEDLGFRRMCKTEMSLMAEIAQLEGRTREAAHLLMKATLAKMLDKLAADFLQSRTFLTADMVMKLMHGEGCTLDAKEALYYGFVHKIIDPSMVNIR